MHHWLKMQILWHKHKCHVCQLFFTHYLCSFKVSTDALLATSSYCLLSLYIVFEVPDWRISATNCLPWYTNFKYSHDSSRWKHSLIYIFFYRISGTSLKFHANFGNMASEVGDILCVLVSKWTIFTYSICKGQGIDAWDEVI